MGRICSICGNKASLFSKANYNMGQLGGFGFASRKIPEYMHYELWECNKCRYLMAENTMGDLELSKQYKAAGFDSGAEAKRASRTYMEYLKKHCPDFPKGKAMDIGTGEGSYLLHLMRGGVKGVVGVEPSVAPVQAASAAVKKYIVNDIFRASDYKKGEFSMISCFQTIEHIPRPECLVKDIYRLLEDGGVAYFVCHDYKSLVNRVLGKKSPIYDIEHLQLFSKRSIYKLVRKSGFGDIKIFTIRNTYPIHYWIRLFPFPGRVKGWILQKAENSSWGKTEISINVGNIGVIAYKNGESNK